MFTEPPPSLLILSACVLGAIVGSFLHVVILRLPRMLDARWSRECRAHLGLAGQQEASSTFNLMTPASHCPHCDHRIRPWENIPILSWLLLRGRCASCATPISPRYPLVELLTAVLSGLVIWHFGLGLQGLCALLLTWALVGLAFIDLDRQWLPDDITLPLLWLGLLINALGGVFTALMDAVIGAMAGYLSLWLLFQGHRLLTKKEGMGHGDFKLMAALGAWLGWQALPMIALLGSISGTVSALIALRGGILQRGSPMAFGPFLAAAGWVNLMWGGWILDGYLRVMGLNG